MPSENICRYCFCRKNFPTQNSVEIDCSTTIECPEQVFGVKPPTGCYSYYQHDQCCSVKNECPSQRSFFYSRKKTCNYKDEVYQLGQKIYPDEDVCKICICSEDWDDKKFLQTKACKTLGCDLAFDKELSIGCLPVYHEATCCPIEYICREFFL